MKVPVPAAKASFLAKLLETNVPIASVIDVGVNYGTPELMRAFPSLCHHLFEPSPQFHGDIEREYALIPHELYPVAVADAAGTIFLVESSLEKNGIATHTQIALEAPSVIDGVDIVSCRPIEVVRLDELAINSPPPYLLKIDIDGQDLKAFEGCSGLMGDISVVIIESQKDLIANTISAVTQKGFTLVDIIDRCYYGRALWQVDLAFIRSNILPSSWMLRPWEEWNPNLWQEAL